MRSCGQSSSHSSARDELDRRNPGRPGALKLGMVNQAVMDRVQSQFQAVGHTELVEDVVEMVLHRLFGNEELFANLLVAETLGHELHDFLFAVAKKRLFTTRPGLGRLGESLHDFSRHTIVEPDFPGVNTMDALHQEIGCWTA